MKKRICRSLIVPLLIAMIPALTFSQQINTTYFMENVPLRHNLNPAFQPDTYYYLSLPVIGNTQINAANNSLAQKNVIYNYNGQTVLFLHPEGGSIDPFYNDLKPNTLIQADFQTNLLSFGFKNKTTFWNFSLTNKISGTVNIPKDVFRFLFYGTPDINANSYNFSNLLMDLSSYIETSFGCSKKIDKKWSVGLKLKYLAGSANLSNTNKLLKLDAGLNNLSINGKGSANISFPYDGKISKYFIPYGLTFQTFPTVLMKPTGLGAGIDVGVTYKPVENLTLSVALLDLGFIRWRTNTKNFKYEFDYSFNGVGQFDSIANFTYTKNNYNRLTTSNGLVDSLSNAIKSSINSLKTDNMYTTFNPVKLNVGVEYGFNTYLSLGLLSKTVQFKNTFSEVITTSINARPKTWLNTSISYSVLGGCYNSFGMGLGLRTGNIHWLVGGDYIAFQKSSLYLKKLNPNNLNLDIWIPYNTKKYNLSLQINLVFDEFKQNIGLHTKTRKQPCHCF